MLAYSEMLFACEFDVSADMMSVNAHVHTQLETLVTSALTSMTSVTDTRDTDVFTSRLQNVNLF